MTEPLPTPEENDLERAKDRAQVPPEIVPGSEDLPDDTRDGNAEPDDDPDT